MKLTAEVRRETMRLIGDPAGIALVFAVPLILVWVYSLLDLGRFEFTHLFRETEPTALILCLAVWLSALMAASTNLLRERSEGVLQRLSTTPFSPAAMLGAKGLVLGTVAGLQSIMIGLAAMLLIGDLLYDRNVAAIVLVLAVLGIAAVGIGLFVSAAAFSTQQIGNTVTFLTIASVSLSGFLKPLADLDLVGTIASYLPFTLGYQTMRLILREGEMPVDGLIVLLAEGLIMLALAWSTVARTARVQRAIS